MQLTNLAFFLFAATSVFALPEPEAAKKAKTKTKTKTTPTATPTGITNPCAGQPFNAPQCTTANTGCLCYTLNLSTITNPIAFGVCAGAGTCAAV